MTPAMTPSEKYTAAVVLLTEYEAAMEAVYGSAKYAAMSGAFLGIMPELLTADPDYIATCQKYWIEYIQKLIAESKKPVKIETP